MSHFIVKLTSGELIYGTIDNPVREKGMIVVSNPLTWHEYNDDDGYNGSALVRYVVGTDETDIPISSSSIISMARMSPIFEEYYEAAVAVQKITNEAYNENLASMTARMYDLVIEYQDRMQAFTTGELVISHKTSNTTIH